MWTEAIILGLFGLLSTLIFKGKELYEVWIKFRESWRKSDDEKEATTVSDLREIIRELRSDNSAQKSAINFLSREQLRYIKAESDLWGYLQWLHDYAVNVCHQLKEQGLKVEEPPAMPAREILYRADAQEFQDKARETTSRLKKEIEKLSDQSAVVTPPPSPEQGPPS